MKFIEEFFRKTFHNLISNKGYRILFLSLSISQVGTHIQDIAQLWYVLAYSHSPQSLGILSACLYGPYTLLGLFSGAMINRFNLRRTMMCCQFLSMLIAFTMSAIFFGNGMSIDKIYFFAVLRGIIMIINNPIRQLVIREIVEKEHLPNAIALNSSIFNLAKIIGPLIGAFTLTKLGYSFCYLINGVSFLFVIAGLISMRKTSQTDEGRRPALEISITNSFRSFNYVYRNKRLRLCFILLIIISVLCLNFSISIPILTKKILHLSALELGLITSTFSLGALLGSFISAWFGRPKLKTITICGIAMGLNFILTALSTHIVMILITIFSLGIIYMLYTTFTNTFIQLSVKSSFTVNAVSLYSYIMTATNPLGGLIIGYLASIENVKFTFLLPGIITFFVSGLIMLNVYRSKSSSQINEW